MFIQTLVCLYKPNVGSWYHRNNYTNHFIIDFYHYIKNHNHCINNHNRCINLVLLFALTNHVSLEQRSRLFIDFQWHKSLMHSLLACKKVDRDQTLKYIQSNDLSNNHSQPKIRDVGSSWVPCSLCPKEFLFLIRLKYDVIGITSPKNK